MAEAGQVVKVIDNEVRVRLNRQEACAKCGACTAGLESKDMFIEATNVALAKEGDWVAIELKEENFIQAVMIMYGIPLIGLLVGLIAGSVLGAMFVPKFAELLGIILGLSGAGLSFLFIHLNEEKFKTKKFKPVASRIVDSNDSCEL